MTEARELGSRNLSEAQIHKKQVLQWTVIIGTKLHIKRRCLRGFLGNRAKEGKKGGFNSFP